MEKIISILHRVKPVWCHSSKKAKAALLCAIVVSAGALLALGNLRADADAQVQALREQAARLEQENDRLEAQIEDLGSVDSIQDIARDELGLVDPDTAVLQPGD